MFLRSLETRVNSLVGLSGSFFAARREVCKGAWSDDLQSDFNTVLNSMRMGLRGVADPDSIGYYKNIADERKEYDRKVRTALRGISVFMRSLALVNPLRHCVFAWQLLSHKLCRWLVPFAMMTAFVSNAVLALSSRWYAMLFLMQMQFIKQYFSVISFAELLRLWSEQQWSLDQRYCVVTFDDGWLDNYVHALPVLRRFAVPATVFLPTTFVRTAKWFWPEQIAWLCRHTACHSEDERRRAAEVLKKKHTWLISVEASICAGDTEAIIEGCKALQQDQIDTFITEWAVHLGVVLPVERKLINWGEAQEMSEAGISFGPHSATHRIMTRPYATELAQEISGSWAMLREKPITTVPRFCYPNDN